MSHRTICDHFMVDVNACSAANNHFQVLQTTGPTFLSYPPTKWKFQFRTEVEVDFWKLVSAYPHSHLHMGIWDFSKFGLSIKSWKLVSTNPPPPPPPTCTWEFWIVANLDSASKVGNWFPRTPSPRPPPAHGNLGF